MMHFHFVCCLVFLAVEISEAEDGEVCESVDLHSMYDVPASKYYRAANGEPARIISVTVVRRFSREDCVENESYFHEGSTLVVKHGCQARFKVCYRPKRFVTPRPRPYDGIQVICTEVWLRSRLKKEADVRYNGLLVNMTLLEKDDESLDCIAGGSYNYFVHRAVARWGCRGRFRICYDEGILALTTRFTPNIICDIHFLGSRLTREKRIDLPTANGGIVSMNIFKEFSDNVCKFGRTYGYNKLHGFQIFARDGCRAKFEVCQCPAFSKE